METTNASTASEPISLSSRYASRIAGQLGCVDRVIITGSLLDVCHPGALERQLHFSAIRRFDLGLFRESARWRASAGCSGVSDNNRLSRFCRVLAAQCWGKAVAQPRYAA